MDIGPAATSPLLFLERTKTPRSNGTRVPEPGPGRAKERLDGPLEEFALLQCRGHPTRSVFCEEIVCCRGDHVRLAVRVRVFAYQENACAVWLMFACKYRSVL